MKRRLFPVVVSLLLVGLAAATALAAPPLRLVTAREGPIAAMLQAKGLIPPGADQDQIDAIVQAYLNRVRSKSNDWVNPKAAAKLAARETAASEHGNLLYGKKLGKLVGVAPAVNVTYGDPAETGKILVMLVEFTDPAHNLLPEPDRTVNNTDYWVPDFSVAHYQKMLFDRTPGALTMANYYIQQSNGLYTVEGQVYGWYRVNNPEYVYGRDSESGIDNAIKNPAELIRDMLLQMEADGRIGEVPWSEYDGDGDGFIDHIMIVHAGAGQEGGGGAQGDDAIWSHSSFADWGNNGIPIPGTNLRIGPYTMMPEDGSIGVFCHEFAHDLGLPDEYDTIYSGESSPAFWTLMASGSWLGDDQALGTCPSSISIWGRYVLGWVNPAVVTLDDLRSGAQTFKLDHSNHLTDEAQAIRVSLPKKPFTISVNLPYSGLYEWWSGMGDQVERCLSRVFDLSMVSSAHLNFWTWYDIEQDWDYGYVEVSTDNGATWTSLPGAITTNDDPNGQNAGNGITGSSNGWILASFDLTPFAGREIMLRFRYWTDMAVQGKGWCIDDVTIPEIGFFDNVESGNQGWLKTGGPGEWTIFEGTSTKMVTHYYLMEWRDFTEFDRSLRTCYNYTGATWAERFSYNPGLLLWYRDTAYVENWVGVHPGHGFLLVVDSHDTILRTPNKGLPWRTRIQVMDAPFGVERTIENTLTRDDKSRTYQSLPPVPNFDDNKTYLSPAYPISGVLLPNYGVSFRVLGAAPDQSAALVSIHTKP
ncbi:MAG: immune inhibitor A [Bacillota bacterium]|nr:immune inhibitor A [Bacillota bacterium]